MKNISKFYLYNPLKYTNIIVVSVAMILSLCRNGYSGNDLSPVRDRFFPFITFLGILLGICLRKYGFSCKKIFKICCFLLLILFLLVSIRELITVELIADKTLQFQFLLANIVYLMPACSAFFWGVTYICIYAAIPDSSYHTMIVVLLILISHLFMVNFTDKELFWMWLFNFFPGIHLRYMVKLTFYKPMLEDFFFFKFW